MLDYKVWWRSKTVWSAIVAILVAAYNTASVQFGLPAIPDFVFGILGALGIYARGVADTKLVSSEGK
ncbi:MAG: hypothetical protein LC650_04970 [Actinobacteria bacterium]|nr:hypothetical protein [Actinomycetota bacterium]